MDRTTTKPKIPLVIVISGIIGAGKSTLIALLGARLVHEGLRVVVVPEPVNGWEKVGLLEKYYGDISRWGYTFQTEAFRSRIMTIRKIYEENRDMDVMLMERSPWDDQIFMEMLHEDQKITPMEWVLYQSWCEMWDLLLPVYPSVFVHLDPTVDECQNRVQRRGRGGEDKITKEYQQSLKEKHDRFFTSGSLNASGVVSRVDTGSGEVVESMIMLKNMMIPCYHLQTKDNFRDTEDAKIKVTEIFKKIIEHHRN